MCECSQEDVHNYGPCDGDCRSTTVQSARTPEAFLDRPSQPFFRDNWIRTGCILIPHSVFDDGGGALCSHQRTNRDRPNASPYPAANGLSQLDARSVRQSDRANRVAPKAAQSKCRSFGAVSIGCQPNFSVEELGDAEVSSIPIHLCGVGGRCGRRSESFPLHRPLPHQTSCHQQELLGAKRQPVSHCL